VFFVCSVDKNHPRIAISVSRVVSGIDKVAGGVAADAAQRIFCGTVGSVLTHGYRDGGATRRGSDGSATVRGNLRNAKWNSLRSSDPRC
jgi:hypothetical protein